MSLVTVAREGHTVHIALNRADKRNALSHSVLTALDAAFDEAERLATQDPAGVRAVVLRGEGPSFCAVKGLRSARASTYRGLKRYRAYLARNGARTCSA